MAYGENYEGDEQDGDAFTGPSVPEGTYRARGVAGSAALGETGEGKPQLGAMFEIIADGPHHGKSVPWYGYFSEKTKKRTLESLRIAGWSNDDIGEIEGFGDTEVDIVVSHNEWNSKVSARVDWVNKPGSGVAMKSPMSDAARKAFAAKMKGEAVQSRQQMAKDAPKPAPKRQTAKQNDPPDSHVDDDLPF